MPCRQELRNALAVYTAISSDYDELQEQMSGDCEFVAFLDQPRASSSWKVEPLRQISADSTRSAKAYKVLSHCFFLHKEFSLWMDGCVRLNVPIGELVERYMADFDMVVHRHPFRQCIFEEAVECRTKQLDDPVVIDAQMARYRREGYPSNAGLHENRVILRRHNDRVAAFNELWWDEIRRGSRRDQLSSPYVARRIGLKVGYFPGSLRRDRPDYNGLFTVMAHKAKRGGGS